LAFDLGMINDKVERGKGLTSVWVWPGLVEAWVWGFGEVLNEKPQQVCN